jgi:hypothetical protein
MSIVAMAADIIMALRLIYALQPHFCDVYIYVARLTVSQCVSSVGQLAMATGNRPSSQGNRYMARKGGQNRSAAIRAYKEKNPDARPKAISEGLAKEGVKVSAGYVSTVLSNERRKGGKRRKKRVGGRSSGYADLVQAKRLADAMGGIEKARSALSALAKILDA